MPRDIHFHFGIERVFEHFYFPHVEEVELPTEQRSLLLCMDATRIADERLWRFARRLMDQGVVYFCCWGPGGKKMHDAADHERAEDLMKRWDEGIEERGPTLMTTWHEGDPLESAIEFWCRLAYPPSDWGLVRTWTSIVVGNPDWQERIEHHVRTRSLSDIERGILPGRVEE